MSSVAKVRTRIQGKESANVGIEGKGILEVVVAQECGMLAVDDPIHASVDKLCVQGTWAGSEQSWVDPDLGSVRGGNGYRRRLAALVVLVSPKPEQFVLKDASARIGRVV